MKIDLRALPRGGNLVPEAPGSTQGYWCTWGAQNFAVDEHTFRVAIGLGDHTAPANALNERNIFDQPGWATDYYRRARSDLYILFDVGWDVPAGADIGPEGRWRLGGLKVAADKFPSCTGAPAERLRKLNELCQNAGWRGAGLWIPAQMVGDGKDGQLLPGETLEPYFRERFGWCADAGIEYWKVDYGARGGDLVFRQMLTRLAHEAAPGLVVEHARGSGPANDVFCPWDTPEFSNRGDFRAWGGGTALSTAVDLLQFSQVLRTYDVTTWLSVPTTLDRVAQILADCSLNPRITGLLQCEDEPYLGAVLGCAIGLMRHPSWLTFPGSEYDPLRLRDRMDEVVRALRWGRIAPAWGVGLSDNRLDPTRLYDSWTFRPGDTWAKWFDGQTVSQGAPARVVRDIPLPEVDCDGPPPYVLASRHPTGAVAVGALPRITTKSGFFQPKADVRLRIEALDRPIGIFGEFHSVTLVSPSSLEMAIVWAQDLAGECSYEITDLIVVNENRMVISGQILQTLGLAAASPGDPSAPGLLIMIEQ